jgi:HSP20 family molecular chaperone IbpA
MKKDKEKQVKKVEENEIAQREERVFLPATDVYEKEDTILIRCDMPGVAQDRVDIRLDQTELEITGYQQADAYGESELESLLQEYETGVFRRKFTVPQLIDRDKICARLRNGVLEVELPKAEQAKPRKIEIATS